ncbi:hypothetical protein ANCCEY_03712 [Ancylostoma ceylanicum]|uniref:MIF4G domain-containing protein n=1 Tax=Ancylostoma ceylanicum TaxID=53326 RepID=A0A0D6M470_9BILA|nr:hypothetical protein ANCCEY_03712 [Ancylostoma ceylanicum]
MDDDQLRELFTSLAVLAQQGPIPVQAYSVLVHNHSPEALAEQLHQKWLADGRFAPIAANIVLHVRKTNSSGIALSSMYVVFLQIDSCVAKCLVKPMFQCLDVLVDNNPDSEDLVTMGVLMTDHGSTLNNINSYLVDRLIVKMRTKICSDDDQMNGYIRRIFLHVLDLWAFGWNELTIPESITMTYPTVEQKETPTPERKKHVVKKEFGSKESVV